MPSSTPPPICAAASVTWKDVGAHTACIVIDRKAYNVEQWMHTHPGGKLVISNMLGKDCTEIFHAFHAPASHARLGAFYMGDVLDAVAPSPMVHAFSMLRSQLSEAGFFDMRPWVYVKRALVLGFIFACSIALSVRPSYFECVSGAVCMALVWQQLAFIGHDAGHASITGYRLFDLKLGVLFGNAVGGVSIGWWKRSHNVHHCETNSVEHDPDIQHLPFLAMSNKLLTPFYSTYHQKIFNVNVISQFFVQRQHYMYYIIMMFARWNLYLQSIRHVLYCMDTIPVYTLECCSLIAFYMWQSMLLFNMPSVYHAVLWLVVSNAACGILHVQITLSHFAMDAYNTSAINTNWVRSQLDTCMNIECNPSCMDWVHGGLQFQIEHHLFPRIPSYRLRDVRNHVKAFIAQWGLPYCETGFIDANLRVLDTLKRVGHSPQIYKDLWDARG
jgi:fatty acid desaturase